MAVFLLYYYALGALILLTETSLAVRRQLEVSVEEDFGGAEISPEAEYANIGTCTPYSDEYYRRVEDLVCDRDYNEALKREIEESKCQNDYYTEVIYDDLPCLPYTDERTHVEKCSESCSLRQFYYFYCTHLAEKRFAVDRECGVPDEGASYCGFDKGDFCLLKYDLLRPVIGACLSSESLKSDEMCSATCKYALENFKEKSGCCVSDLLNIDYKEEDLYGSGSGSGRQHYGSGSGSGSESESEDHGEHINDKKLLYYLFSACYVDIPAPCTDYLPPKEFLDCTREVEIETTTDPPATTTAERPVTPTTGSTTDIIENGSIPLYSTATVIMSIILSLVASVLAI